MRLNRSDLKIFDSAVAHHASSSLLAEKSNNFHETGPNPKNSEGEQVTIRPWMSDIRVSAEVLRGFAAELYLKGFIQIYGAPQKRIYGLYEFFTALPEDVQSKLQAHAEVLELDESIQQHLQKVADSFARVRYIHEGFPGTDLLSHKILKIFHKHLMELVKDRTPGRFSLEGVIDE